MRRGLVSGMGLGAMWFFIYAAYSLAFWYGTSLILDSRNDPNGRYTPSNMIIVSILNRLFNSETIPFFS